MNNFESIPAHRNPARGAKFDGGVAESEAAGGSPRKKPQDQSPRKEPRGAETFLHRLDRTKAERGRKEAVKLKEPHGDPQGNPDDRTGVPRRLDRTTAKQGRKKAVEPRGDPDDRTKGSHPKKSFPPVTQEVKGVGEPDQDEEELDNEDIEDDDGLEDGFTARDEVENKDAWRPTDDVTAQACVALALEPMGHPPPNLVRPNQPYNIAARAPAALRDDEPYRNPRLVRDHPEDSSVARSVFGERRGGTMENEASTRTKVKTAPVLFAKNLSDKSSRRARGTANFRSSLAEDEWEAYKQRMVVRHGMENAGEANLEANPSSQVSTALFGSTKAIGQANFGANPPQVLMVLFGLTAVFGSTTGGNPQGKTGQGISAAEFLPATTAGGIFRGKQDRA